MSDYWIVIREDAEIAEDCRKVFGGLQIPVISAEPSETKNMGTCYVFNNIHLTREQAEVIVAHRQFKFGLTEDESWEQFNDDYLCIPVEHVLCVLGNPVRKF